MLSFIVLLFSRGLSTEAVINRINERHQEKQRSDPVPEILDEFARGTGLPACAEKDLGELDCLSTDGKYKCECARRLLNSPLKSCKNNPDEIKDFATSVLNSCSTPIKIGEHVHVVSAMRPVTKFLDVLVKIEDDSDKDMIMDLFLFEDEGLDTEDTLVVETPDSIRFVLIAEERSLIDGIDARLNGWEFSMNVADFPCDQDVRPVLTTMAEHGLGFHQATTSDHLEMEKKSFCEYKQQKRNVPACSPTTTTEVKETDCGLYHGQAAANQTNIHASANFEATRSEYIMPLGRACSWTE